MGELGGARFTGECPLLDDLLQEALSGNSDIKLAKSRVRQVRAKRGLSDAEYFPTLGVSAGATGNYAGTNIGSGSQSTMYSSGFDASWAIDIFGGTRRAGSRRTAGIISRHSCRSNCQSPGCA